MSKSKSDQIIAKFECKGDKYEIRISGRGPTVVGKQAEHVTSHGLIVRGIVYALRGIIKDESYAISDPRKQRGRFYDFISAIAALNPDKRQELYEALNEKLKEYNKKRTTKTKLIADYKKYIKVKNLPKTLSLI